MPRLPYLLASVLLFAAASIPAAAAAAAPVRPDLPSAEPGNCPRPDYPAEAKSRGEQGITTLGMLVGTDGAVRRIELLGPSGSAVLDTAAQESMARCRFSLPCCTASPSSAGICRPMSGNARMNTLSRRSSACWILL